MPFFKFVIFAEVVKNVLHSFFHGFEEVVKISDFCIQSRRFCACSSATIWKALVHSFSDVTKKIFILYRLFRIFVVMIGVLIKQELVKLNSTMKELMFNKLPNKGEQLSLSSLRELRTLMVDLSPNVLLWMQRNDVANVVGAKLVIKPNKILESLYQGLVLARIKFIYLRVTTYSRSCPFTCIS